MRLKTGRNIEKLARGPLLGCVEKGAAHRLSLKGGFVGMVALQRCARGHLPNSQCFLVSVKATAVEVFHHGVPDRLAFELPDGSDIQLDGVYVLGSLSLARTVSEEEVHHRRQLST